MLEVAIEEHGVDTCHSLCEWHTDNGSYLHLPLHIIYHLKFISSARSSIYIYTACLLILFQCFSNGNWFSINFYLFFLTTVRLICKDSFGVHLTLLALAKTSAWTNELLQKECIQPKKYLGWLYKSTHQIQWELYYHPLLAPLTHPIIYLSKKRLWTYCVTHDEYVIQRLGIHWRCMPDKSDGE